MISIKQAEALVREYLDAHEGNSGGITGAFGVSNAND